MKKINKMMLLSMSAFVPLVTIVACSSKTTTEEKALEVSGQVTEPKTAAKTVVKMTVKNLPASPEMGKLVLHLVQLKADGKDDTTKKSVAAKSLSDAGLAEFEFTDLTAATDYRLEKVVYDAKKTLELPATETANKFKTDPAAAASGTN